MSLMRRLELTSWHLHDNSKLARVLGRSRLRWRLQALEDAKSNNLMLLCVLLGAVSLLLLLLHLHITCWGSRDLSPDIPLSLGACTSLPVSRSLHCQDQKHWLVQVSEQR